MKWPAEIFINLAADEVDQPPREAGVKERPMASDLDKQWRVRTRQNSQSSWVSRGLYETRVAARLKRAWYWMLGGYERLDTEVVPYVKSKKR